MSQFARVTSIDALQTLATALQRFRSEAASAVEDADVETHRAMGWMQYDCKEYWAREVRRSEEAVAQARLQLKQARAARKVADHDPICADEERALKRAQRRQETAQRKVEAVRRWTRTLETSIHGIQRSRIVFLAWLDTDVAQAIAALHRMSASLESYTSLEAPEGSAALASELGAATLGAPSPGGVVRAVEPKDAGAAETDRPSEESVPPPPDAGRAPGREETGT